MAKVKETIKDVGIATVKGGIGAIPVVGSFLNEYINLYDKNQTDRIMQEWDNRLAKHETCLEELNKQIFTLLGSVPPENVVIPQFNVICAAIEAAKYQIDDENLRSMFAHLIVSSMDCERNNLTHPSFVEIIKQLTPDEAKILKIMPIKPDFKPCEPIVDICYEKEQRDGVFTYFSNLSVLGFEACCEYPKNISAYISNLCRLGIAEIPDGQLADIWRYDKIKQSEFYLETISQLECPSIRYKMFGLTELGITFCGICLPLMENKS